MTGLVVVVALALTDVKVQFNTPLVAVDTAGVNVFCVIVVLAVAVHPLAAVTVKL